MLGLSKSLSSRLLAPAVSQLACSTRHRTVNIPTITIPHPNNEETMGPYPRTKEERELAAKKYNLIPEDYETYPEDEGWGDYPKLPAIGDFNKYKYDDFDDPSSMRHYGEPYHRDADLYQWHKIDPLGHEKHFMAPWKKFLVFMGTWLSIPVFCYGWNYFNLNFNYNFKKHSFEDKPRYYFPPSPNDDVHSHHKHDHH